MQTLHRICNEDGEVEDLEKSKILVETGPYTHTSVMVLNLPDWNRLLLKWFDRLYSVHHPNADQPLMKFLLAGFEADSWCYHPSQELVMTLDSSKA